MPILVTLVLLLMHSVSAAVVSPLPAGTPPAQANIIMIQAKPTNSTTQYHHVKSTSKKQAYTKNKSVKHKMKSTPKKNKKS